MPWVAQRSYSGVYGTSPLLLRVLGVFTVFHVGQAEAQPSISRELVKVHLFLEAPEIKRVPFASFLGYCADELAG